MGENSKIEWTDHTFNPWVGCTKISPACDHCYAERWAKRTGQVEWGGERHRTSVAYWAQPLRWNVAAALAQVRRRVFCCSLADVFDNQVPPEWRYDLFKMILQTPWLDWLLLTKRIGNAMEMIAEALMCGQGIGLWKPLPNVWLGATVVNQEEMDRDVPKLQATPAVIHFLSVEPMLGPMSFRAMNAGYDGRVCLPVQWVICGGESGPGARPLDAQWARTLMLECLDTGTPFFMKQGSQANWPDFKDFESFPASLQKRYFPRSPAAIAV